jgi:hypothetical protein
VLGHGLSGEEQDKLYDEMDSFLSKELQEETPTPSQSVTLTPEPTPPELPAPNKPEFQDYCADTNLYQAFDYGRAEQDIGHFCEGGVDLLLPAAPIWNTYEHADTEV